MDRNSFARVESRWFWTLAFLGGAVVLTGLLAAHTMEVHGHVVTAWTIRWSGHAARVRDLHDRRRIGVLNVASIGSVFGQAVYKARAPLSGLLCLALLVGGLFVLMLDLGRPERMVVAATHYNFKSVFAWNVFPLLGHVRDRRRLPVDADEPRLGAWSKPAGLAASPGASCSRPARAPYSGSSSPARPTARRCWRRSSS